MGFYKYFCVVQGEFVEGERAYKSAIKAANKPRAVYYGNLGVLYHRFMIIIDDRKRLSMEIDYCTITGGEKLTRLCYPTKLRSG